ncbi:uncharacterized protein LOC107274292 isoform X1 [Cephus cinctus]|uniref:Uncharacterized protein LOC107274292 isoform X1 n=1 Tax=Cephus cinctus TaxID=211228 RepID=A0AAJ7RUD6_CEPCN|nr:uncharacterized protein LOC107274292 isoform X1 [Cephus cinctus]
MSIKISASVASRVLQGILHDWEITRLVMSDHLLLDLFATVNVDRNTGACAISTDHFRRICAACANCLYKFNWKTMTFIKHMVHHCDIGMCRITKLMFSQNNFLERTRNEDFIEITGEIIVGPSIRFTHLYAA